jgi:hypothetical protein
LNGVWRADGTTAVGASSDAFAADDNAAFARSVRAELARHGAVVRVSRGCPIAAGVLRALGNGGAAPVHVVVD